MSSRQRIITGASLAAILAMVALLLLRDERPSTRGASVPAPRLGDTGPIQAPAGLTSGSTSTSTEEVAPPTSTTSPAKKPRKRDDKKRRVRGTILDGKGKPIAKARIQIKGFAGRPLGETLTDEEGRYEYFIERDESAQIVAEADGLASEEIRRASYELDEDVEPLVLRKPGRIVVVVCDERGQALAGAKVVTYAGRSAAGGEEGTFRFEGLSEGRYLVQASAPGFIPDERFAVVVGEETTSLSVSLTRGGTIFGTVRDAAGEPVVKAYVRLVGGPRFNFNRHLDAWTDEHGVYELAGVPPGPVDLIADKHLDYNKGDKIVQRLSRALQVGERLEVNFVLGEGSALSGRLTDENGAPLRASVWLKLTDTPGMKEPFSRSWGDARTEADGRFTIRHVPEGTYSVLVSHHRDKVTDFTCPLHVSENVTIAGPLTTIDLVSPRGAVVEGVVRDEGEPLTLSTFMLDRDDGVGMGLISSLEGGRFRIEGVPPGSYWFWLYGGGIRKRVVVPERGEVPPFELEVAECGGVKGRLFGPGRAPLQGVGLKIRAVEGRDSALVTTDFSGGFKMREESLTPGEYRIEVDGELELQARRLKLAKLVFDTKTVTVKAGEVLEVELVAHE